MTTTQPAALPERFTKKPVTIEAVQFKNDGSSYALILWINEGQHAAGRRFATWRNDEIIVPTLEGEHIASVGDWIIKGVKGEFYPCKPDIFEMTYDRAALQPQPASAVSDAEISRLWSWSATAEAERTATTQQHAFAYALLALRPQAVPMTDEQSELEAEVERLRGLLKLESLRDHSHQCLLCLHPYTPLENQSEDCPSCGFDGITAQGAQGGEAK